jgi:hypothetical protein
MVIQRYETPFRVFQIYIICVSVVLKTFRGFQENLYFDRELGYK